MLKREREKHILYYYIKHIIYIYIYLNNITYKKNICLYIYIYIYICIYVYIHKK